MYRCKKCGSRVFFIDIVSTYLEIDGEIGNEVGCGEIENRNCVKCTYPQLYEDYAYLDQE